MKKVPSKRLPLNRETLAPLQGSALKEIAARSDGPGSHAHGCNNDYHSVWATC